jgi:dUTP pyrophosphatase
MVNLSTYPQTIEHGDRIAQMVISKVEYANIIETVELSVTDRGYGGFGSTGEK